ncbi:tRNA (cytidine(34)-2'-O)-methyltransferase [Candidatus Entotheonellaceae bacterium PAL068K]
MLHIVLFEPEIPPNTGNIIRLCANTGAQLHLIHPLGFAWDDTRLRRAGLDYHEWARVRHHTSLCTFLDETALARLFAMSTRGCHLYSAIAYRQGDALLFGPESRGLPAQVLHRLPPEQVLRIPMMPHSRSVNIANAAAIVLYEAWRQLGFTGGS